MGGAIQPRGADAESRLHLRLKLAYGTSAAFSTSTVQHSSHS